MHYIILLVGMLLILIGSISSPKDPNLEKVAQGKMSQTEYKGHTYTVWSINLGGGIVHDPDCQCQVKEKQ